METFTSPSTLSTIPFRISRPILITVLLSFLAGWAGYAFLAAPTRSINVAGVATRKVSPESVVFTASVNYDDSDRNQAISEGERQFNQMLEGLRDYSLSKVDRAPYQITNTGLALPGLASSGSGNKFRYSNTARITLSDPSKTQAAVAYLYSVGADSVSQARFIPKDETELGLELRKEAIQDSRRRAKAMAKASGFSIGRALGVQEQGSTSELGTSVNQVDATGDQGFGSIGEIELSAGVVVTYAIRYLPF